MKHKSIEALILFSFVLGAVLTAETGLLGGPGIILYITAVFLLASGFYLSKSIKKPLDDSIDLARRLEKGEFNFSGAVTQNGKFGELQTALTNLAGNFEKQLINVTTYAHRISAVYNEVQILIDDFLHKAELMDQASASAASATEEMSVNISGISSSAKEASVNISGISSSTEEMTSTVNEIARNSEKARQVAQNAVRSVAAASGKVSELGNSAQEISKIIDVIEDISDQTKLLALNATIEAARAGETGKGFAVVAAEVKDLAGGTAHATEDIQKSVYGIQGSTKETSSEMEEISKIITHVEENISSIASAVEEQNVTTREIAVNINKAADGIKEITQNVSQTAEASQLIARDTLKVSMGAKQMLGEGENLNENIKELSEISRELEGIGNAFKFSAGKQGQLNKMVKLARLLQDREKDHLQWVKKVQNAIAENLRQVDVQKDPALCGFGKFLNSAERKEVEKEKPNMKDIFTKMDEPHAKLHQSAVRLEEMLRDPAVTQEEIENYYKSNTLVLLKELLDLFHQAIHENFRAINN